MIANRIPKTFCNFCKENKKVEEMVCNNVYGPGYKYLCKKCDILLNKERRKNKALGIRKIPVRKIVNKIGEILCIHCNTFKSLEDIYFNKAKQKHINSCIECRKRLAKEWRLKNKDRKRVQDKESRQRNAQKMKEKRVLNKDKKALYDRERRKFRKRDLKKERERDKERRNTNPFHHLRFYLRRRIKKAFRANGYTKISKSEEIIGLSWAELVSYFLTNFSINILDKDFMKDKHIDHICPLAQAQDENELIKLCHYTNLQIMPALDNLKKSDKKTPEGEIKCKELLNREWIEYES